MNSETNNKVKYVNGEPVTIIDVPTFADDPFAFIDDYNTTYQKYRSNDSSDTTKMVAGVNRSTKGKSAKAVESTKQVDNSTIIRRIKALGLACLVAGGVTVSAMIAREFHQNSVITPHVMSFHEHYVHPNTHRTWDNQNYYYDYEDIAKYLNTEHDDFSRRL